MTFRNQVIYVTGASAGIGRELARQLAGDGATLALFARRRELLDSAVAAVAAAGGRAQAFACDVTDRASVLAAFGAAEKALGPADVLIANAGVGFPCPATRGFDAAAAARIIEVNVIGAMYSVEAALPAMLARGKGQIVGISSLASYGSLPESHVYCASKAALSSFLAGLRIELRGKGVAVTTICPGFIRTDMTATNVMPMPLLLDCDVATRRMLRAIRARRKVYNFPKRMYWLVKASRWLPDAFLAKAALVK